MGFDLENTYLALDGKGGVIPMPVTDDFWMRIDASPAATRSMMAIYVVEADGPQWEMHPHGEEVLVLLDGRLGMEMDDGAAQYTAEMHAGTTLIVPAPARRRALVRAP
ncbi:MAG: hypothetical protein WEA77_12260, partial [Hyphomonas sp.]|uniref:cupin domain-containing protein n=1 Tax=Hyphomonas sp. TaxID=87 RepID=UPI0034A05B43